MSLSEIQSRLKAPKKQKAPSGRKFAGYHYRSCEDILEVLKPLLKEYKLHLTISDSIETVLDRVYIKATGILFDERDGKEIIRTTGLAREQQLKGMMDEAQITGSASSYARKYMLGGMFLLDDTRDPDAQFLTEDGVVVDKDIVDAFRNAENGKDVLVRWESLKPKEKRLYEKDKDEAKKRLGL